LCMTDHGPSGEVVSSYQLQVGSLALGSDLQ
jgi:hypothetical protein